MRRLLAALALLTSCALAQDRAAAPQKNWKDKAEYELANAALWETDPAARLANLDRWAAEFSSTEYIDERWDMYLSTYQQLNDAGRAFDVAQKILQTRPNNLPALAATVSQVTAIKPAPTTGDLDAAERAANLLINTAPAPSDKPPNMTAAQWAETRDRVQGYATQVLPAIDRLRSNLGGDNARENYRTPAAQTQKVEPQYSEEARLAGLEGTVVVTGTITGDGMPHNLRVSQPLGLGLDEQAIAAAAQVRFTPGSSQPITIPIDFALPSKQSRWHLVGAEFMAPAGASRPTFAAADYPLGPGIGVAAYDEATLLGAIGRAASATVSFDIDEHGYPGHFQVVNASLDIWGPEAVMVVQSWRFHPGMKAGLPISVPCTLKLVWGPEDFSSKAVAGEAAEARLRPEMLPASEIVFKTEPEYTEEARQARLEGAAVISLIVDETGVPRDVQTHGSLGMGLDESAKQAISQWRFQPMLLNGRPAAVALVVRVEFRLTGVESFVSTPAASSKPQR
jgi:TonB family protein